MRDRQWRSFTPLLQPRHESFSASPRHLVLDTSLEDFVGELLDLTRRSGWIEIQASTAHVWALHRDRPPQSPDRSLFGVQRSRSLPGRLCAACYQPERPIRTLRESQCRVQPPKMYRSAKTGNLDPFSARFHKKRLMSSLAQLRHEFA